MSVSENFDRKFNKCMRGYNPDEVDAAVDALLRYCDELEDANREFEIANNDLIDEKRELMRAKKLLLPVIYQTPKKSIGLPFAHSLRAL